MSYVEVPEAQIWNQCMVSRLRHWGLEIQWSGERTRRRLGGEATQLPWPAHLPLDRRHRRSDLKGAVLDERGLLQTTISCVICVWDHVHDFAIHCRLNDISVAGNVLEKLLKRGPFYFLTPDVHRRISKIENHITLLQFLNKKFWPIVGRDVWGQWREGGELPCREGSFSNSLRSVGWNREECVFLGDFIASARGTSFGMMERRSKDGPLARLFPIAKSPGIVSTAPGGGGCYNTVSIRSRNAYHGWRSDYHGGWSRRRWRISRRSLCSRWRRRLRHR